MMSTGAQDAISLSPKSKKKSVNDYRQIEMQVAASGCIFWSFLYVSAIESLNRVETNELNLLFRFAHTKTFQYDAISQMYRIQLVA